MQFNWKASTNKTQEPVLGIIAQEVESTFPQVVRDNSFDGIYKTVAYKGLTAVLIEAVKELKAENDALRARLDVAGL